MRKIKVDKRLEDMITSFYTELFKTNTIFSNITSDLDRLKSYYSGPQNKEGRDYIEAVKDNLPDIVCIKPAEMNEWKDYFDEILDCESITKVFWKDIVKTLRYSELRKFPILELYRKLQINTCIYCNAQLATVLDSKVVKSGRKKGDVVGRRALFELDHYNAKSLYPFLSISFFNLLPTCSYCNKAKSSNPALFYLYTETDELDVFRFSLDSKTIIKYWRTRNLQDLKITFDGEATLLENHNKLFLTQEMYETQIYIVEELLHKRIAYNRIYKSALVEDYTLLFPDKAIINRLLVGNLEKAEEIHKRPLAKFTQDIAEELGLIT